MRFNFALAFSLLVIAAIAIATALLFAFPQPNPTANPEREKSAAIKSLEATRERAAQWRKQPENPAAFQEWLEGVRRELKPIYFLLTPEFEDRWRLIGGDYAEQIGVGEPTTYYRNLALDAVEQLLTAERMRLQGSNAPGPILIRLPPPDWTGPPE
jgi:hypothetical protein